MTSVKHKVTNVAMGAWFDASAGDVFRFGGEAELEKRRDMMTRAEAVQEPAYHFHM